MALGLGFLSLDHTLGLFWPFGKSMENDGNEEVGAIGDLTQLTVELVCILCVHDKAKLNLF